MRLVSGLFPSSGTIPRRRAPAGRTACAVGILAALAGLLLVSAGVTTASAGGAALAASDPESGLARYGSCLNAQRDGDLLLLLDTSSSMQLTDPEAARVDAADYLLQQMASYTQASGVTIAVAVAGFADTIESVAGWTPLDSSSVAALTGAVDSFRDRVDGFETDYWTALEGARQSFAERAQLTPDVHRCQAVAWFTDGELKISARTSDDELAQYGANKPFADGTLDTDEAAAAATGAAADDICRAAGIADQLRANGVVTLAIGLAPTGAPAPNFDLLRSISTGSTGAPGSAGAQPCGSINSPSPGEFYTVADVNDLMLAFDRLSTPGQAPIENQKHVCQGGPCAAEQHSFVIDDSIPAVHILATADAPGLTVLLTPPSGVAITVAPPGVGVPQSTTVDDNAVGYTWRSDSAVSIDLSRGPTGTGWPGLWSVTFVDPSATTPEALSRSSIHLSADLFPAWLNRDAMALSSGPNAGLQFGVVNSAGTAVTPAGLTGTAILSVDVVGADGKQFPIIVGGDRTGITAATAADLTGLPPGPATMRMTLQLATAATVDSAGQPVAGTALAPRSIDLPVVVSPAAPVGADTSAAPYPTVAYRVDFGTTDGVDPAEGQLTVNGSGCVWLDTTGPTSILGSPKGVGQIAVSSPTASSADSCLAVAAGGNNALPLVLTVDQPQTGGVDGSIVVMIAPDGHLDRAVGVPVSFTADVRKPLVPELFAAVFAIALILALGLPLAMLYVAKYWSAKIPQIPLAHGLVPVTVVDGQVSRTGGGFALNDADTRQVVSVSGGGRRRLPLSGVELRTKVGRSPIGSGYVVVESPGRIGAAGGQPPWTRRGLQARLPLAAHNNWAILHDPAGDPTAAEILVLLDASGDDRGRQRIAEDVRRRAGDLLSALREAAEESGDVPPTPGRVAVGVRPGSAGDEPASRPSGSSGFLFGPDD